MSDFRDPYLDYENGVLRNLVKATSEERLNLIEADITSSQATGVNSANISRTNDLKELQAIHKHLFEKIYDWAGQIRIVDIFKNVEGADYFLLVSQIYVAADYVFGELKAEDFLRGLEHKKFVERLAYFYDQLNFIHPFREGNGRTQRIFWSRVAKDAGYLIDWDKLEKAENDEASRMAAENSDLSLLVKMIDKVVGKI